MKAFFDRIVNIFTTPTKENENLYKEWDRLRAKAMSPSERAEIDAIFSRGI